MRKTGVIFTALMLLIAAAGRSETYQPNTGHLRGFIYKSDGQTPLWGGQVVLQDVKNNLVFRSNVTDSTGDYKLLNVPSGEYKVLIVAKSRPYKVKTIDFLIKIVAGKTATISFSLQKAIKGLFFLEEPCCLALIIAGTAGGKKIRPNPEPPEASPTIPPRKK